MRGLWLAAMLLPVLAVGARAAEVYVTRGDRIMCTTQRSLREALTAIEARDRATMRTVQGCHYSREGVRAEMLQDGVSMIKVRLGEPDSPDRAEFWTLPDTIKEEGKR